MSRLRVPGRVVIVGASIAGLTTAEALRAEGHEGEILVVGAEPSLPYGRPPLSKQVLHGVWEPEAATLRTAVELAAQGITVRTDTRIDGVDVVARTLRSGAETIPYDALVIATGVGARTIPGVLSLRTVEDAVLLRSRLTSASSVVVLGTGVLGSEIASAARAADLPVTMVGRSATLSFGAVGRVLSDRLVALHRARDVQLRLGVAAVRSGGSGDPASEVRLSDGTSVTGDLVVAAIGGTPHTDWLRGTPLDIADGVHCDTSGRAAPDVYAVGDVARWDDPATGTARRVEHQTNAIEQALSVAATIVHGAPAAPRVPFFWSEVHGVRIQAYGSFSGAALSPVPGSDPDRPVLVSRRADGSVEGIVGWSAARAFREARSLVTAAPAPVPVSA